MAVESKLQRKNAHIFSPYFPSTEISVNYDLDLKCFAEFNFVEFIQKAYVCYQRSFVSLLTSSSLILFGVVFTLFQKNERGKKLIENKVMWCLLKCCRQCRFNITIKVSFKSNFVLTFFVCMPNRTSRTLTCTLVATFIEIFIIFRLKLKMRARAHESQQIITSSEWVNAILWRMNVRWALYK